VCEREREREREGDFIVTTLISMLAGDQRYIKHKIVKFDSSKTNRWVKYSDRDSQSNEREREREREIA
jgi:hypothetical protein